MIFKKRFLNMIIP